MSPVQPAVRRIVVIDTFILAAALVAAALVLCGENKFMYIPASIITVLIHQLMVSMVIDL